MNSNIGLFKSDLIDLQQYITLNDIFNGKNNAMECNNAFYQM